MTEKKAVQPSWDDTFTVGVAELDDQHRNLFRILEGLRRALEAADGKEAPLKGLRALARDCSVHFSTEEGYMERFGYPGAVKQRVQHRLFAARLDHLLDRVQTGEEVLSESTVDELRSWLLGHIVGLDREYADFFREKGLGLR